MKKFHVYKRPAPVGSFVVRIVEVEGEPFGFIREVHDPEEEDTYPTEQKPIDQVWRLLHNKLADAPHAPVFIETDAHFEWRPEWGELVRSE